MLLSYFQQAGSLYTPVKRTDELHTWTTSVHLGSESKFLVWIAKGDRENIGSAQDINTKQLIMRPNTALLVL
jgi:hypothetical protein